jgi:hypothetical protein
MQPVVVGVDDVVGDEDNNVGDEGMMDKDVEGSETSNDKEGSCWTPRLS